MPTAGQIYLQRISSITKKVDYWKYLEKWDAGGRLCSEVRTFSNFQNLLMAVKVAGPKFANQMTYETQVFSFDATYNSQLQIKADLFICVWKEI